MKLFSADRVFWQRVNLGPGFTNRDQSTMTLYCWPCQHPHVIVVPDVERLVYALGFDAADRGPTSDRVPRADFIPSCLLEVLRWSFDLDGAQHHYGEHVEQGIECREKS